MMGEQAKPIVIFDLDGTLTDSAEGILKSVRIVLSHYGITVPEGDTLNSFIGPPLRVMFPKYGVPEAEVENAVKLYRSRYFSVGKFENTPYPGIREMLSRLSDEGYRLYVATSKPETLAVEILQHFSLAQYFGLICGATIGAGRDSKGDVLRYLFATLGEADPSMWNAVMVGDTVLDVNGANELGIPAIGVSWGYGDVSAMREAGAVAIAETPEELYELLKMKKA